MRVRIPCRRNGTIEPCSHYTREVSFSFFHSLWVRGGTRRKFHYQNTDGTMLITCLAVQARSRRPHTHGLISRPWTNVIRFTGRAGAHFPPSSDSCLRPPPTPPEKKTLLAYVRRKEASLSVVYLFLGCVPYETERLSIRRICSHLLQITRYRAVSTIFFSFRNAVCVPAFELTSI